MTSLRIIQLVGWYMPRTIGGTEVYVSALAAELEGRGHEVVIVVPDERVVRVTETRVEGLRVLRYPRPAVLTRDEARGIGAARGAEHLRSVLATERPDVVHAHTFVPGLGLDALRAAREVGARVVATTHSSRLGFHCERSTLMRDGLARCDGVVDAVGCTRCALGERGLTGAPALAVASIPLPLSRAALSLPGKLGTALGGRALFEQNRAMQRELYELADPFVVLTSTARRMLIDSGAPADRVVLNRLGVRALARRERRRAPGAPLRIGYVGRFEALKGVDDLLDAVAPLEPGSFELELRGPMVEPDRIRLATRLATTRATLRPALLADEVPDHLASLDLLVCPSRCLEGGPTVALEAHAVGTPVLGTRGGGLEEALGPLADDRLFEAGDVPALRALLRRVTCDPASTIDRWRAALPPTRTMREVTDEYVACYA